MTTITSPTLPKLSDLNNYLLNIWESKQITNNGIYCQELEKQLADFLNVKYINVVTSGTFALWAMLKSYNLTGEVITTPYTFAATINVLESLNLKPVFVDVLDDGCIDPSKIESVITDKTSAILAVHTYGNPCDVIALNEISKKYNIKLFYDAAHAFNVKINNKSILTYGDASAISFHATKIYNTVEGGAVVSHNKNDIDLLRNFGIKNDDILVPGLNGKLDEIRSAIGLLNLQTIETNINNCKTIAQEYLKQLHNIKGISLPIYKNNIEYNYSYFPIYIDEYVTKYSRDYIFNIFKKENIMLKKYFYPLICNTSYYELNDNLPNANRLSNSVICLPLYSNLTLDEVNKICNIIKNIN